MTPLHPPGETDGHTRSVPTFITHYYRGDRLPFLNLSDLDPTDLDRVLSDLATPESAVQSHRRFGRRYMDLRRGTEYLLRKRFIEVGGRPERTSPHYFVLGESAWFEGLYSDPRAIRIPLADLPADQVSFTYPDSMTSMGLLAHAGISYPPQPYHGIVFHLDQLQEAIAHYGVLNSSPPDSYEGHQGAQFEHYIEVQVWTDEILPPS